MYNKLIINTLFLILSFSSLYSQASNIEKAYMFYRNRNYAKSAEMFEYEIKNSPVLRIEYFEVLATIYMRQGDYENTLRVSRDGIVVNRHSSKLYFQKGYALYKLGKTSEAILSIKKSLILDSTNAYMHNFIGLLYLRENDYKQAESSFLKATVYSPSSVVYLRNLGASYERQANYTDALQSYEKSYKINPNYSGLIESLARVRKILGDDNITTLEPTETELKELEKQQIKSIEDLDDTISSTNQNVVN